MSRMKQYLKSVAPTLAALPVFAATVAWERSRIERAAAAGAGDPYNARDARTSTTMGVVSSLVGLAVLPVEHAVSSYLYDRRLITLRSKRTQFLVGMVVWDFTYYWWHRSGHRSRILWAVHAQHHSSEEYNLTTALRQGTPEISGIAYYPLAALVGVSPEVITLSGALNLLYQYGLHTKLVDRLPAPVELVLNTPSHHRAHHGSNQQYLDKNYAGISIVFDRLFGTFEPEVEPVTYGLTTNIDTYEVGSAISHEFRAIARDVRAADTLGAKLGAIFGPPGWTEARAAARRQEASAQAGAGAPAASMAAEMAAMSTGASESSSPAAENPAHT